MAKSVIKGNAFLWNGHRLSKFTSQATLPVSAAEVDSTVWEEFSLSSVAGLRDRSLEVTGCAGSDQEYDILAAIGQDETQMGPILFPLSDGFPIFGDSCVAQNAWLASCTPGGTRGELAKFDVMLSAVDDLLVGKIFANTLNDAGDAWESPGLELGALGAGQVAFLCVQVSDLPGVGGTTPEGEVVLESDVDDTFSGPPNAQITISGITEPGAYLVLLDGDTDPVTDEWWRATFTSTGTSPTFPLLVGAGIWNRPT